MSDLVERLRNYPYEACKLAADRIEALAQRETRVRWLLEDVPADGTVSAAALRAALGEQE